MNFSEFLTAETTDEEKISFFESHEISVDDIVFAVKFFQKNPPTNSVDICGTGGSGHSRINASTLSAFVLAAAGVPIAKHGNRAASGRFGSFDLLEKLGINIDLDFFASKKIFDEIGLGFFFAPKMFPEMGKFGPARKEFGKPTIFNLFGPLLSPTNPTVQMIGTSTEKNAKLLRDAALQLGKKQIAVIVGDGGLDELSPTGENKVFDFHGEKILFPKDFGISEEIQFSEILSPNSNFNISFAEDFLAGNHLDSPHAKLIFMNSAFAMSLFSGDRNYSENFEKSRDIVASGAAREIFKKYRDLSHQL